MKKLSLLLVLMMVVALFAGCSGDNEPTQPTDSSTGTQTDGVDDNGTAVEPEVVQPSGDPLQMLWWNDGVEGDVMQGIIDDFTAETGIIIELVVLGWDDYSARLRTMIRGGEAPALIRATEGTIMEFKNFLEPLDGVFDPSEFTNVYYDDQGALVVLPMDVTANGLFVNYDLLDKYDVNYPQLGDDPWTWAEFEAEMSKLKGQEGVAFPGVFDKQAHRFFPMVYQFGGTIWDTPYTVSNLTQAPAVEALTTLKRMNSNGTLDPAVMAGSGSPNELFQTGQYGFHMSGNWFVAAYQNLSFNWGVVPMPIGNDNGRRATIIGGKGICAVQDSGQEAEAKQFIAYLSQGENHDKFAGGVPFLSPRLDAKLDFGAFQNAYEVFQDELANTPQEVVLDWQTQVAISGMYPMINLAVEVTMGGDDPLETLQRLEEQLIETAAELGLE